MAFLGTGGNPWKIEIEMPPQGKFLPAVASRAAFQLLDSATLFTLFGLTCFVRYGIPCIVRRSRFQGEILHFKTLSFALITYAVTSALEGSEYATKAAAATVTFEWYWVSISAEFFRSLAYCSTISLFYRVINWFLDRIHKESKISHAVMTSHWVALVVVCAYSIAFWAWFVYSNVFVVDSLEVEKFHFVNRVEEYMLAARRILYWVASLEILLWIAYSAFHTNRSHHRAARNAGLFALLGSFIFHALAFTWAVVSMQWGITHQNQNWGVSSQLAVTILELIFTATAYLGILLTCMKLAVLGDDLNDKTYEPAIWTEEEARPVSQDVSRPVSPMDEGSEYSFKRRKFGPVEMDTLRDPVEVEGSTEAVIEMEGSGQKAMELDGGPSREIFQMEDSSRQRFEMLGSINPVFEADSGISTPVTDEKIER